MLNSFTNPPTNPNPPTKGRDMREDALERLYYWLDVLEKRFYALLDTSDPELMSPAQRVQAAIRYLTILPRFLQLQQKYAELSEEEDDPEYARAPIGGDIFADL